MMNTGKRTKQSQKVFKSLRDWMEHYDIDRVSIDSVVGATANEEVSGAELADMAMDNIVKKRKITDESNKGRQ